MTWWRLIMISIILKLGIHEWRKNPDLRTWRLEYLLKNCHHSGIVLPVPAWLKTKLGRGGGMINMVLLVPSSKALPCWIQEQTCCRKSRTSIISWSLPRKVQQVMGLVRAAMTITLRFSFWLARDDCYCIALKAAIRWDWCRQWSMGLAALAESRWRLTLESPTIEMTSVIVSRAGYWLLNYQDLSCEWRVGKTSGQFIPP